MDYKQIAERIELTLFDIQHTIESEIENLNQADTDQAYEDAKYLKTLKGKLEDIADRLVCYYIER